jgi:hypothetical protein
MNGKINKIQRLIILILIMLFSTLLNACTPQKDDAKRSLVKEEDKNDAAEIAALDKISSKETSNSIETKQEEIPQEVNIEEKEVYAIVQRFCEDMTESWRKLERADMSDYLVDNLDTHLVLNWIDYDIADRKQNTWKQIKTIDAVDLTNKSVEVISENQAKYEGFAEIKYTRYDPDVTGIGLDLSILIEKTDEKWMITGADFIGASIYREWKDNNYTSIEEMDQALEESCGRLK